MNGSMMDDTDGDWTPPTAAEEKLIQARRERSDKISNLMGKYLLKGYKMLNELCQRCSTILMQDKRDKLYCVACLEVDAETDKDNPAINTEAARSLMAEGQLSDATASHPAASCHQPAATSAATASLRSQTQSGDATADTSNGIATQTQAAVPTGGPHLTPGLSGKVASMIHVDRSLQASAVKAVEERMLATIHQLKDCESVEDSSKLVRLIGECADTLGCLRRMYSV